jgi:transcription elongation GreA/GreB family factor
MQLESLIKLIASGNVSIVEEEWMRMLEAEDLSASRLLEFAPLLSGLYEKGRTAEGETLAWAAVEAVSERVSEAEALRLASGFLLAIGKSAELRNQVADLYRAVYADCKGIEALLEEAGITGGRPARRAVRTLDVCLGLREGDYLAERHEGGAARVEAIDRRAWRFTLMVQDGTEQLGAVMLADRFAPAPASDFRVMRQFDHQGLVGRLHDDPVAIITEICNLAGGTVNNEELEERLVGDLLAEDEWKRWWVRARTALKKDSRFRLNGRSPYEITVLDASYSREEEMLASFAGVYDPLERLGHIERYLADCKAFGREPSREALGECLDQLVRLAQRADGRREPEALPHWLAARRTGELAGIEGAGAGLIELLRNREDLAACFDTVRDDRLLELACNSLIEARPDDWRETLASLLPRLPAAVCDKAAALLAEAACEPELFKSVVDRIVASPIEHNEALLWLWDGPSNEQVVPVPPLRTVLNRILLALGESRRDERLGKEVRRRIGHRARAVLSARKYARFRQCLDTIEHGVALALRTQLARLDNLGRTVHADLLRILGERFPVKVEEPTFMPWERDDILYTTPAGMARRQREIDQHVNVKMRDNARAIGEAAARGDLSENAEYKFALEERDLLRARLAQMNAEMEKAHVIEESEIPTDHVGIGTRVAMERLADNERYDVTVLGPWETDVEAGIINYQTPLAHNILGKGIGDTVELDHEDAIGEYRVVAISAHLL